MKKDYVTLDVICNRDKGPSEKLVFNNGKFETKPYATRTFLANEGPLSVIERTAVNLLEWADINSLKLPSDIDGFSIVLSEKSLLTSKTAPMIQTTRSKCIISVDSKCNFGESLSETLKKYATDILNTFRSKDEEKKLSLK